MASLESRRRVSYSQLEALCEFLNSHRDIATGFNKSTQARAYSRRMWETVAQSLNSYGEGATKDWKGWSSYWVDYKAKLKRKVANLRASQAQTGGGPSHSEVLNDVEKRFLDILGQDYGSGLPGVQVDPFPNLLPASTPFSSENSTTPRQTEVSLTYTEPGQASTPPFISLLPTQAEVSITYTEPGQASMAPVEHAEASERAESPLPPARRRRRRNRGTLDQQTARRLLVESTNRNSETFVGILNVLTRIADYFETIRQVLNALHLREIFEGRLVEGQASQKVLGANL